MRNDAIDFSRLVAAFFVITLHVGYYQDVSSTFGELIRISGRWAVPFFFLVSGYYIGLNKKENECHLQALRILKITIVSSVIFLPYCLFKEPNYFKDFSFIYFLRSGTYFHLWFLSSLMIGLLFFKVLHRLIPGYLVPLSLLLISLFIATDIFASMEKKNAFSEMNWVMRHAMSLAFIIIGHKLSQFNFERLKLNLKMVFLIFVLTALYFMEPFLLEKEVGSVAMLRQFPVFTVFITILVLIACLKIKSSPSVFLSESGRDFSLGIYLLHPLFLPVFYKMFLFFNIPPTVLTLVISFVASWFLVFFLMNKMPLLYNILYGKWTSPVLQDTPH